MKLCVKCNIHKEESEFYRHRNTADNLRPQCKACHKFLGAVWRKTNRVRYQKSNRDWYHKNREYRATTISKWAIKNKDKVYKINQERAWKAQGIVFTVEQREVLLKAQDGRCTICGLRETKNSRRLAVDHCHATGKIRGLLCDNCNRRIVPIIEKHIDLLPRAREYLGL